MSIFDKILGKSTQGGPDSGGEEKSEKPEKEQAKPEAVKTEKKTDTEKKSASPKTEKAKTKSVKKAKADKPKKEITKRKVAKKEDNIAHKILLENLISEKSTMLASQNKYVFRVAKQAGKFQVKEAVEGYYGVQVVSVNTIKIQPKKRIHGRTIGWKKGFKKAVVTLRQGDTIGAAEGV